MKRTILAAFTLLLAITLQAQKRVNNRLYNPDPAPVVSVTDSMCLQVMTWTRQLISVCPTGSCFPLLIWNIGRIMASF